MSLVLILPSSSSVSLIIWVVFCQGVDLSAVNLYNSQSGIRIHVFAQSADWEMLWNRQKPSWGNFKNVVHF